MRPSGNSGDTRIPPKKHLSFGDDSWIGEVIQFDTSTFAPTNPVEAVHACSWSLNSRKAWNFRPNILVDESAMNCCAL